MGKKAEPILKIDQLRPASLSKTLINNLLRDVMGFNGLAITDATPMMGFNTIVSRREALIDTINANIDMILFNKNMDEDYEYIRQAVKDGHITEERINESVTRNLATKLAQNVMTLDGANEWVPSMKIELNTDQHKKIAEEIACQSITLVKDETNLLPVTPNQFPRVRLYVVGDKNEGGFKAGGQVTSLFIKELEQVGFEVSLYNKNQLDLREIFTAGVEDMKSKLYLAIYVANVENASNQPTTRIDWIQLMAADAPWFVKDIPTLFISMANPYHYYDVPYISTFINAYSGTVETVQATVRKIVGLEPFEGKSPVNPIGGIHEQLEEMVNKQEDVHFELNDLKTEMMF